MIIIITNNISGLWGLFSGPIIGLDTLVIIKRIPLDTYIDNGFFNEKLDVLINQSKTFNNNLFIYNKSLKNNYFIINNQAIEILLKYYKIILIGESFLNIKGDYVIKTSNFIEETSQLSQILAIIYNNTPNKPPLSSIAHSTSIVKK
jgi:hypothetical protein